MCSKYKVHISYAKFFEVFVISTTIPGEMVGIMK